MDLVLMGESGGNAYPHHVATFELLKKAHGFACCYCPLVFVIKCISPVSRILPQAWQGMASLCQGLSHVEPPAISLQILRSNYVGPRKAFERVWIRDVPLHLILERHS